MRYGMTAVLCWMFLLPIPSCDGLHSVKVINGYRVHLELGPEEQNSTVGLVTLRGDSDEVISCSMFTSVVSYVKVVFALGHVEVLYAELPMPVQLRNSLFNKSTIVSDDVKNELVTKLAETQIEKFILDCSSEKSSNHGAALISLPGSNDCYYVSSTNKFRISRIYPSQLNQHNGGLKLELPFSALYMHHVGDHPDSHNIVENTIPPNYEFLGYVNAGDEFGAMLWGLHPLGKPKLLTYAENGMNIIRLANISHSEIYGTVVCENSVVDDMDLQTTHKTPIIPLNFNKLEFRISSTPKCSLVLWFLDNLSVIPLSISLGPFNILYVGIESTTGSYQLAVYPMPKY